MTSNSMAAATDSGQSFWDHLDALRAVLIRVVVVTVVTGLVAFL